MLHEQRQKLWEFVRGDAEVGAFEAWLYADDGLEAALGEELYLELIACNFSDKEALWKIRNELRPSLEAGKTCECASVRNLDGIGMEFGGFCESFFATQSRGAEAGPEQWWLYVSRCNACGTNWLVAQEERIHDMFYVERIADELAERAKDGTWPDRFKTFANVLQVGVMLGCPQAKFVDPMAGALQVTVAEILSTAPEMPTKNIAKLLGVTPEQAKALVDNV